MLMRQNRIFALFSSNEIPNKSESVSIFTNKNAFEDELLSYTNRCHFQDKPIGFRKLSKSIRLKYTKL